VGHLTRYGILDDEDQVIRWVWRKPGPAYRFITQRRPRIDWDAIEEALF